MYKRQSGLDMLRIVSAYIIIVFHSVFHGGVQRSVVWYSNILTDLFMYFGETGASCFFLISGFFYDSGDRLPGKKLPGIVLRTWLYTLGTALTVCFFFGAEGKPLMSYWAFPLIRDRYWFVTVYALLLLFKPVLSGAISALKERQHLFVCLAAVVLWSVLPTFLCESGRMEVFLYSNRFVWSVCLYLIGAFVKRSGIMEGRPKACAGLFIGALAALVIYISVTDYLSLPSLTSVRFWRYNSLFVFSLSLSLFLLFRAMPDVRPGRFLKLSSRSLGVYLYHDGPLRDYIWIGFAGTSALTASVSAAAYLLFCSLLVFVIGCAVDAFGELAARKILAVIRRTAYSKKQQKTGP